MQDCRHVIRISWIIPLEEVKINNLGIYRTIAANTDNRMLDKDKQQGINYNYTCIEDFSIFPTFNDMGEKFGLDSPLVEKRPLIPVCNCH
jgi:hypothetical protein